MSILYNVVLIGQSAGPYDVDTLARMVQSGMIDSDTLAWRPGMADWRKIGDISELESLFDSEVELYNPDEEASEFPEKIYSPSAPKSMDERYDISGLIFALVGLILLISIQLLPFRVDRDKAEMYKSSLASIQDDLYFLSLWIGGALIGSFIVIVAVCLVLQALIKNHKNTLAIVALFICFLLIPLSVYTLSRLPDMFKKKYNLEVVEEKYDEYIDSSKEVSSRRNQEQRDAINDVTAEIDRILS